MRLLLKAADTLVYLYTIVTVLSSVLRNLDIFFALIIFGMTYQYGSTVGIFVLYRKLKVEPLAFGPEVLSLGHHFSQSLGVLVVWNFAFSIMLLILGAKLGDYDWVTIGDLGRVSLLVFVFALPALITMKLQDRLLSIKKSITEGAA